MKRGTSVLLLIFLFAISFASAQVKSTYSKSITTQTNDVIILPEEKNTDYRAYIAVGILIAIVVIVYLKRRNTKIKKKTTSVKKKAKKKTSKRRRK